MVDGILEQNRALRALQREVDALAGLQPPDIGTEYGVERGYARGDIVHRDADFGRAPARLAGHRHHFIAGVKFRGQFRREDGGARLEILDVLTQGEEPWPKRLSNAAEMITWRAINAGPDDVKQRFVKDGGEAIGGTPSQFADLIRNETKRWAEVVRVSGARID